MIYLQVLKECGVSGIASCFWRSFSSFYTGWYSRTFWSWWPCCCICYTTNLRAGRGTCTWSIINSSVCSRMPFFILQCYFIYLLFLVIMFSFFLLLVYVSALVQWSCYLGYSFSVTVKELTNSAVLLWVRLWRMNISYFIILMIIRKYFISLESCRL